MSMPIEAVVAEREEYERRIEDLEQENKELRDLVMQVWFTQKLGNR